VNGVVITMQEEKDKEHPINKLEQQTQSLITKYLRLQERNIQLQQQILELQKTCESLTDKNLYAADKLKPLVSNLRRLMEQK
jgi:uncharacterized protein YlxW (UPF0749 family)